MKIQLDRQAPSVRINKPAAGLCGAHLGAHSSDV